MKKATFLVIPVLLFLFSTPSRAQKLEVGGGWAHVTSNFGVDGFNAGADYWLPRECPECFLTTILGILRTSVILN